MKSYTDLEQSRKLAEFLLLESADMCYKCIEDDPYDIVCKPYSEWKKEYKGLLIRGDANVIPCWSLAALLDVLPYPSLHKTYLGWRCDSYNKEGTTCEIGEDKNNSVDACVAMIEKLYNYIKDEELL